MTKIAAAVEHLRGPAQDRAEQFARAHVQRLFDELAGNDWDANATAPFPHGNMSRAAYTQARTKFYTVQQLTTSDKARNPYVASRNSPNYRIPSEAAVERFVAEARTEAAAQYDAFVAKLEGKIGPVVEATLEGEHVWGYSLLDVTTESGERQIWKTQMILNVSKLGKVFNQWPTRKVKN